MNEILRETFRHGAWATRALVESCRSLSAEQLNEPGRTFGSILATFNHIVLADAAYASFLTGVRPQWSSDRAETESLDDLLDRVNETHETWKRLFGEPLDSERELVLDSGKYTCRASVVITQALHHGAAHREQIRSQLKEFGVSPPDLQPWEYAVAVGRARHSEK